jgi:beta-N-acetylhexosaminidase
MRDPGRLRLVLRTLALAFLGGCASSTPRSGSLSLDEKIGQLFVFAARGSFVNEQSPEYLELLHRVRDQHVGGILWYQSEKVYETAWLNRRLQAAAPTPLLIAVDAESGLGMRFEDTTDWPWPMAVAATGNPALAEREGAIVGQEARALGINQLYTPVADVNLDPDNPNISVRSFGEDPADVARFVAAFVRGAQSAGVIATVKHFPGHGDTHVDPHRSLPVLDVSEERLDRVELVPFRAAIAAGVRAVMTAHMALPALDPAPAPDRPEGARENPYTQDAREVTEHATVPASLSAAVTDGLLRGRLGFRGLVVTDAVDMGALVDHYGPGETAVRAILAGADQIPKSPDLDAAIEAVRAAVRSGRIPMATLDAAVGRVLEAKRWAGAPVPDEERIFRLVDRPEHVALAAEIAQKSVTLLRDDPPALPLSRAARVVSVAVTDAPERIGGDLARELDRRLSSPAKRFSLDTRSGENDVAAILDAARGADAVLLLLYLRPVSGRGAIALPPAVALLAERLGAAGARVVTAVFGSPYVLRGIPRAPTELLAYGSQRGAQVAAARALFGEAQVGGKLPVTIPGVAPRGAGIERPVRP